MTSNLNTYLFGCNLTCQKFQFTSFKRFIIGTRQRSCGKAMFLHLFVYPLPAWLPGPITSEGRGSVCQVHMLIPEEGLCERRGGRLLDGSPLPYY